MKRLVWIIAALAASFAAGSLSGGAGGKMNLKELYGDDFLVGVAANEVMIERADSKVTEILAGNFSALTPENEMKWMNLQANPGQYDFRAADKFVQFAEDQGMMMIGHTLVWHSQTPEWVFEGESGAPASREQLLKRMRDHIYTVAGRYRGRAHGWDVVNEAVADDGANLRDSPWRKIVGDDFIEHAFRFAHEADPEAELYYNDYGLVHRAKRARTIELLLGLIERKVPIHGVGMQGHWLLDWPEASEVEAAIEDFAALGLKVMITELDIDVLPRRDRSGIADIAHREEGDPTFDPFVDGFPEEMQAKLARRYVDLFKVFLRQRDALTRVTFWGLHDGQTWLNNFPIRGRTNHPLLFDRNLQPKPAYFALSELGAAQ